MRGALLGPAFGPDEIRRALDAAGARYETLADADLIDATAAALAAGKAAGWFQGRMEFGPRALGNRSILADAPLANHAEGRSISRSNTASPSAPLRRACSMRTPRTGSTSTAQARTCC